MEIEYIKGKTLLDFINNEKQKKKINQQKALVYFNTCCIKSINELENKFSTLNDTSLEVIMGIKMFYNVFFIILSYTNNLTFTMFLSERAILLYTEFIIMSKNTDIIKDLCYYPSITDAILFAYKKTIGPINICNIEILKKLRLTSSIMRDIYIEYFKYNKSIKIDELVKIDNILSNKIFKFIQNNEINEINNINTLLSNINCNNFYKNLLTIKYIVEYSNKIIDDDKEYSLSDLK